VNFALCKICQSSSLNTYPFMDANLCNPKGNVKRLDYVTISAVVISVLVVISGSLVPTLPGDKAILLQSPFPLSLCTYISLQN